ncbi:hypothetical protein ACPC54_19005 [Kitasatospora sp. NPDC094028]
MLGVVELVSLKPMKCPHNHTSAQIPAIAQPLILFALGRGLRRMWRRTTWYPSGTGIGLSPPIGGPHRAARLAIDVPAAHDRN